MGILIGGVNIKFLTASVFPVGLSGVALGATLTPRSTLTHIVNSLGTLILEGSIFKGVNGGLGSFHLFDMPNFSKFDFPLRWSLLCPSLTASVFASGHCPCQSYLVTSILFPPGHLIQPNGSFLHT